MFRSETEFVRWLLRRAPSQVGRLRLGIGDDAALVEVGHGCELILTTDLSIEDVHFLRRLHPPRSVGHRALARSLSDVAAMGGTPRFALVSLAISKPTTRAWVEEFYMGLLALAARLGVAVIGGDTAVVSGRTTIDVMVTGEVRRGRALRRSGARPGDHLFVSGQLGMSALGLRTLKSRGGRQPRRTAGLGVASAEALNTHLYPEPRCALGRLLSEKRLASALIDVSDGLSTDLSRLCEASGVGARVWANRVPGPVVPGTRGLSAAGSMDLALHGGEDYELLFTVPPHKAFQIPTRFRGVPVRRIGEICPAKELLLVRPDGTLRPLEPAGYDHFRGH